MARMLFDFVVGMTVRDEQVYVTVVVIIEEFQPPAAHQESCTRQAHLTCKVLKGQVVTVAINRIHLLIDVRDE